MLTGWLLVCADLVGLPRDGNDDDAWAIWRAAAPVRVTDVPVRVRT